MAETLQSLQDLTVGETLGTGTFGRVRLVHLRSGSPLVLKVVKKETVLRLRQEKHVRNEKEVLMKLKHPFVVRLWKTFQDRQHLYFLLDYHPGGELFSRIPVRGLPPPSALFYASELLLCLSYVHSQRVLYRDLKPENVLLDARGHLVLADFGFAKEAERSYTLCGTPDYVAPEVILRKSHGVKADWWSFGVVLYEMLTGVCPFAADSVYETYQRVMTLDVAYGDGFPRVAKDLVSRLLARDEDARLGNSAKEVQAHAYFSSIDWEKCLHRTAPAPWTPKLQGLSDSHYFHRYAESEDALDTCGGQDFDGF